MTLINLLDQRYLNEVYDRNQRKSDVKFFKDVFAYVLSSGLGCLAAYFLMRRIYA